MTIISDILLVIFLLIAIQMLQTVERVIPFPFILRVVT